MTQPKLFISYSWTNTPHEQWVIDLATQLVESNVDVILDKWELKEGHDANAFMEKMVTDPEIKKVLIICDQKYVSKANGRAGGVGTETQIISQGVYDNQAQDKFVAVIAEKNEDGSPCLPVYYKSRIYIDLSTAERYSENFDRLLRWIYDKPLYVKPAFGKKPSFLEESETISLSTTALFNRCLDAVKNHRPQATGSLEEYFGTFATNLERFRIVKSDKPFDDLVIESIEEFTPYRNEMIQLLGTVAQYADGTSTIRIVHRFFEQLLPYLDRPQHISSSNESDFDNFRFIIHELLLYAVAIYLKYEKFDDANYLLQTQYYLSTNSDLGKDVMVGYQAFQKYIPSLQARSDRLKLRRISLHADLLKERSQGTGIDFGGIMQVDFIAFLRNELEHNSWKSRWWPTTLLYIGHTNAPFQIFARSSSKSYFDQTKILLTINTPTELSQILQDYKENKRQLPHWDYSYGFSPAVLLGYEQLATRP